MKRKVLFIINNFAIGGVERFLYDIVFRLDKKLYEVTIVTVWGSGALIDNYQKLDIPILWAGSKLNYNSENSLLKLYFFIISPITLFRLVRLICRLKPDVVMSCLTQADILGMFAAWLCCVRKRILHSTDVKPLKPLLRWLKRVFAINLSTKIIVNSTTTKEFVLQHFQADCNKIVIIPDGIQLDKFSQLKESFTPATILTVGFIGRLEPIKGPQYLVEALLILKNNFNITPHALIFGSGSMQKNLQKFVDLNNLNKVQLKGEILNPIEAYREIDIVVVPSISEGFGLVVLEGLVANKVVVASNTSAIRELIQSGENGVLFTSKDPKALADVLKQLISNSQNIEYFKRNAYRWFINNGEKFSVDNVAQEYQRLLLS